MLILQRDEIHHTSTYSWHFVHDTYPGRRIGGSETLTWPSSSSDVVPLTGLYFGTFEVFDGHREDEQLRRTSSHRSGPCRASRVQPDLFQEGLHRTTQLIAVDRTQDKCYSKHKS